MTQWKTVSISRTGLSHRENNTQCQDRVRIHNDGTIIAVLADGVGSLRNSAYAAECATNETIEWFRENRMRLCVAGDPLEIVKAELVPVVSEKIRRSAGQAGLPIRSMDCNLVFACILPERNGAICGRLGDAAVCIIGSQCESMCAPVGSANRTDTILDSRAVDCLRLKWVPLTQDVLGFVLTSDGLDNVLYMKGQNFVRKSAEPFFNAALWEDPLGRLNQLVERLTEDCPSYDDDISVAVLSRAEKDIELEKDPTWLCSCGNRNELHWNICEDSECGRSLVDVYDKYSFTEFGGKYGFFLYYNQRPEEERKLVGLPRQILSQDDIELPWETKSYDLSPMMVESGDRPREQEPASVSRDTLEYTPIRPIQSLRSEKSTGPSVPPVRSGKSAVPSVSSMKSEKSMVPPVPTMRSEKSMVPPAPPVRSEKSMVPPVPTMRSEKSTVPPVPSMRSETPMVPPVPLGRNTDWQNEPAAAIKMAGMEEIGHAQQTEAAAATFDSRNPRGWKPDTGKRKKLRLSWIALIVSVVLLLVSVIGLWSVKKQNDQLSAQITELISALENGDASGDVISLDDGSRYYGDTRDGEPHGSGILMADGKYWIGSFSDGLKNGRFLVVSETDVTDYSVLLYRNGKPAEAPEGTATASVEITDRYVVLRDNPDASGESVAELEKGAVVYPVGTPVEVDGTLWIQVAVDLEEGPAGWCRVSQTSYEEP